MSAPFKKFLLAAALTIPFAVVGNDSYPYDHAADDAFVDSPTDEMLDLADFKGDRKPAVPDMRPSETPVERADNDQR